MSFGWVYTYDPLIKGPSGSIQVADGTGATTGSQYFMYYREPTGPYPAHTAVLTGSLVVSGTVSASHYHVENVVEIDSSGSTYFGNTNDDVHIRTGSLTVVNASNQQILQASATTKNVFIQSLAGGYHPQASSPYTTVASNYIIGLQGTDNPFEMTILSSSNYQPGSILIIKDETGIDRQININRQGSDTIDGETVCTVMSGTYTSVQLYTNGTKWLIF
tara:strand:- start:359 stop:1015 length:657 start_codon:yes stop_codon:yes gene_type:complete